MTEVEHAIITPTQTVTPVVSVVYLLWDYMHEQVVGVFSSRKGATDARIKWRERALNNGFYGAQEHHFAIEQREVQP